MSVVPRQSIFQAVSISATSAARLFFAATIILIPVRYRWVIVARPVPPLYSDYTDFLLFASDVAMLSMLALWIISLILSPHKIRLGPRHIWIPLIGLTLAGWITLVSSFDPILSFYHSIRLIALFWFYVYIINEIHSAGWVLIPIGLLVVSQAVVAIGQSITQHSLGIQILGEYELNPTWSGVSILENGTTRFLRAYGLSDHPNILGGCIAFGLVLLLAIYIQSKITQIRLAAAFGFIIGLPALLLTFSRSGWLAFLTGAALLICAEVISHRVNWVTELFLLVFASILLLAPFVWADLPFLGGRFDSGNSFQSSGIEQQSLSERALLFEAGIKIFIAHPITGVGLGASPEALKNAFPEFPANYQPPHFTLLTAAEETGIFGASFYFLLLILPWVIVLKRRKKFVDHPILIGASTLLLSITVVGFFDYYTWLLVPGRLWQWLAWGLWAIAVKETSE